MPDFLTCENNILTTEQLVSALLTKTSTGDQAIRTMIVDACSEDAVSCSNNSIKLETNLIKCIGVSSCGKPAIRLGIKPKDLATALGIPSYANAAAAETALATGLVYFNEQTSKIQVTIV